MWAATIAALGTALFGASPRVAWWQTPALAPAIAAAARSCAVLRPRGLRVSSGRHGSETVQEGNYSTKFSALDHSPLKKADSNDNLPACARVEPLQSCELHFFIIVRKILA